MFAQMISEIKQGRLPNYYLLQKRFEAALVKKTGVIKTPYSLWPTDTKINPPAKQLLWATILLQDKENFKVVEAIISTELEEKLRAKGEPASLQKLADMARLLLHEYLQEFIDLAPDADFRKELRRLTLAVAADS